MQDNSSIFSRIKKAYGWIIFGKGSGMLLTIFYTPLIITQLGNNYGLIAVGSLIAYFIQTLIDAVSAWTYNNESKKNIKSEGLNGATLNFHLITITSLVILAIWTITILFLTSTINSKFGINNNLLILFLSALSMAQLTTFLVQQFEVMNYVKHSFYILQRVGVIRKWVGVMAVLLYYIFQTEVIILTIILAHFSETVFIFLIYRKVLKTFTIKNFNYKNFINDLIEDNFFRFLPSHIFSGTSVYFVLFGFSYLVTAFFDSEYISGAAAVMVIFNTIIVFASFLTKPLYSLLSENFYSEIEVVTSFIKSDKDFLIQRIFNFSILISLICFLGVFFFGNFVLELWLGGLHSSFYNLLIICSCAFVAIIPSRAISYSILFSGKMFAPALATYLVTGFVYSYISLNLIKDLEQIAIIYVLGAGVSCIATSSLSFKSTDASIKNIILSSLLMFLALVSCILCISSSKYLSITGLSMVAFILISILINERNSISWILKVIR